MIKKNKSYYSFLIIFFLILFFNPKSFSKENINFLTLKNNEVNLRQGPSFKYPIKLVYKKKYDVRESAPAKGLCFVNSVYEENIFKRTNKNDLFPKFVIRGYS